MSLCFPRTVPAQEVVDADVLVEIGRGGCPHAADEPPNCLVQRVSRQRGEDTKPSGTALLRPSARLTVRLVAEDALPRQWPAEV